MDIDNTILNAARCIASSAILHYDQLPDIDLYVEQMTSYLEDKLGDTLRVSDEKIITKPMVNNYTKAGLLPRPNQKRYTRDHLITLAYICLLKQSLSFNDIQLAFDMAKDDDKLKAAYADFAVMCEDYRQVFVENQKARLIRIKECLGEGATDEQIALLYITLNSVEATADKLLCSRLLQEMSRKGKKDE